MKTPSFARSFFLLAVSGMIAAGYSVSHAQDVKPDAYSLPVIPPGKAGEPPGQGASAAPATAAIETTIADIMRRPLDYKGRDVVVASEVEEIYTTWSFKLDEKTMFKGGIDNDLLVVAMEPLATMGFTKEWLNKKVAVTGTVRILMAADFRREYGRGVDDRLFRAFEGKPALIATSIRLLE